MVDGHEAGDVNLEARLSEAWHSLLSSQESAAAFISESKKKDLGGALG